MAPAKREAPPSRKGGDRQDFKPCPECGGLVPVSHKRCRRRTCPAYSSIWAGDVEQKGFAALRAYESQVPSGTKAEVAMLTVTGPGQAAGVPWDEAACSHLGPHRHSGPLGCRAIRPAAETFNRHAPAWWRELHRVSSQAVLRRLGIRPRLLLRVFEMQRRGVLHVHPVVGYSTLGEKQAADAYLQELVARSQQYGFGYTHREAGVQEPTSAPAYLSAYFIGGKKDKRTLRESVTSRQMPRSIFHVALWLSTLSGVTMRSLRLKRFAFVVWSRLVAVQPELADQSSAAGIYHAFKTGQLLPAQVAGRL